MLFPALSLYAFLNYDGTNLESGTGAFLAKVMDAKLENVFVHMAKVTLKNCNAMLIGQSNHGGAQVYQNVIVAVDQIVKAAGATRNPLLQTIGSRNWSAPYTNLIGIAPKTSGVTVEAFGTCENDGKGNAINWKSYQNHYSALTEMDEDFASGEWDETFWHEVDGVILPKTVRLGTVQTYEVGNNTAGIQKWVDYKKNVEGVAGYTYKSDYTYNANLLVNLTSYNFTSVSSATIGGVEYASGYSGGTLSIPKNTLTARGDSTLLIVGTVDGKTVSIIQPLVLADILISTADDFEAMQWLADEYMEDTNTWCAPTKSANMAGYIVLTNNITYNRTYKVHQNSAAYTASAGFAGILDGRGYKVDGLEMVEQPYATNSYPTNFGGFSSSKAWGAGSGIFAAMYGGTIKNIAFTNAKHSCGGGFITSYMKNGNTIENVYVHLLSAQGNDTSSTAQADRDLAAAGLFNTRSHAGGVAIKNVFAKIDAVSAEYYSVGAFYANTIGTGMQNVYIVTASSKVLLSDAGVEATAHSGLKIYANAAAATADKEAWSKALPAKYWNVSGALPAFL